MPTIGLKLKSQKWLYLKAPKIGLTNSLKVASSKSLQSGFYPPPTPPFRLCFHFGPSTNPHSTILDTDYSTSVIISLSFWADLSDSMRHDSARNWNPSFCAEQSSSPPLSPSVCLPLFLCTCAPQDFLLCFVWRNFLPRSFFLTLFSPAAEKLPYGDFIAPSRSVFFFM
jgi:hypothetical protein